MIQLLVGTRPEAIKLAPVARALGVRGVPTELIATGQQGALLDRTLAELGLRPDVSLRSPSGVLGERVGGLVSALSSVVRGRVVVVHGDTATALAGALAAFYAGIPVAHVEAGLRSDDLGQPFPEEAHRVLVDRLSTWWFAPTAGAAARLVQEGCAPERVHQVGNTVVDALIAARERPLPLPDAVEEAVSGSGRLILATCHRRENLGAPLARVVSALETLAREAAVVWMRHPNPAVPRVIPGCLAVDPLEQGAFVRLLERADVVLTDSGGVQEEAVALGRRALVLREVTERPEGVEAGLLELVGTDVGRIVAAARAERRGSWVGACPYGVGDAGERIAGVLARGQAP